MFSASMRRHKGSQMGSINSPQLALKFLRAVVAWRQLRPIWSRFAHSPTVAICRDFVRGRKILGSGGLGPSDFKLEIGVLFRRRYGMKKTLLGTIRVGNVDRDCPEQ
jgi:hypothetical protein